MTDQQVEIWRKDFESMMKIKYPLHSLKRLPDDSAYIDRDVFYIEQGFLMAKRNQPVIELPNIELPNEHGNIRGQLLYKREAQKAITAAGYQYKVKG